MLALSRKANESIIIRLTRETAQQLLDSPDSECLVEVMICRITGNKVRVGIVAPRSVNIVRKELDFVTVEDLDKSTGRPRTAQPAQPPLWPTI